MRLAALGACPKCGYGFAGKKPTPKGMVKLDPTDPKYDPTKPCPNCEMGLEDTSSSHKEDTRAGQEWHIYDRIIGDAFGPFPDKDHADSRNNELVEAMTTRLEWTSSVNGYSPGKEHIRDMVKERFRVVSPQESQDISRSRSLDVRPIRDVLRHIKRSTDEAKEKYYKSRPEKKEPNVASIARIAIKYAALAIEAKKKKIKYKNFSKKKKDLASKNIRKHHHHLDRHPGGHEQAVAIGLSQAEKGKKE